MRTYTEEELLKAVEYACGMQKAEDYSISGHLLLLDDDEERDSLIKLIHLKKAVISVLDILSDTDTSEAKNITIEEINEYIDENT